MGRGDAHEVRPTSGASRIRERSLRYDQVRPRPLTRLTFQALEQIGQPATGEEIFAIVRTRAPSGLYTLESMKNDMRDFSESANNRQDPDPARRPPILFERMTDKGPRGANLWWFAPVILSSEQDDLDLDSAIDVAAGLDGVVDVLRLMRVRTAQAQFRRDILARWGKKCCVTKLTAPELLIASHIKPWRAASSAEKIDVDNGLLLSPNYDKFFDRALITFDLMPDKRSARLLCNPAAVDFADALGIDRTAMLTGLREASQPYIRYHNALYHDRLGKPLQA